MNNPAGHPAGLFVTLVSLCEYLYVHLFLSVTRVSMNLIKILSQLHYLNLQFNITNISGYLS